MSWRYVIPVTAVLLLMIRPVNADRDGFDCSFPIGSGEQSIQRFTLTESVHRCLRHDDYADLTVVNSQGVPVPITLDRKRLTEPEEPETYRHDIPIYPEPPPPAYGTEAQIRRIAQLTGVTRTATNESQWTLANKHYSSLVLERTEPYDALSHIAINAQTNGKPVNATLIVEESDDMNRWTTLVQPRVIHFLDGSDSRLHNNTVQFDATGTSKYLRLAMLSSDEDFASRIESVTGEFIRPPLENDAANWSWIEGNPVDAPGPENEWRTSLPGLFPVSRIRLTPAPDMVLYRGTVYAQQHENPQKSDRLREKNRTKIKNRIKQALDDKLAERLKAQGPWRRRADFTQYHLVTETNKASSSDVEFRVTHAQQWKLAFSQPTQITPDNAPLIEFGWEPRQITFVTQGTGPFLLLAGRDEPAQTTEFPSHLLDTTITAQSVRLKEPALSADNVSLQKSNDEPTLKELVWGKVLLWLVLCLGVGIMLTMAYRLSKK